MAQRDERTRQLIEQMTEILRRRPGLDKHRIAAKLAQSGTGVDTKAINSVLYGSPRFVADKSETLPKWSLATTRGDSRTPTASSARVPQTGNRFLKQLTRAPRPWQIEALAAWNAASRCGVIEAVTGTGKTFLGVLAAREQLERGGKVVVLVPGKTLAGQWKKGAIPPKWDGKAAERIVGHLKDLLAGQ